MVLVLQTEAARFAALKTVFQFGEQLAGTLPVLGFEECDQALLLRGLVGDWWLMCLSG